MIGEKIQPPHYYAGLRATWGPWKPLTPGRMSYLAGFRWYRAGFILTGNPTVEFK